MPLTRIPAGKLRFMRRVSATRAERRSRLNPKRFGLTIQGRSRLMLYFGSFFLFGILDLSLYILLCPGGEDGFLGHAFGLESRRRPRSRRGTFFRTFL
ncbi:MAG: hypothetical protein AB3N13_14455 [Arenibacterium sp.]